MQENNEHRKHGAGRKFFQEKGYYIVLFLCIAAIGISGYIFLNSAMKERDSLTPSLSVATQAEEPAQKSVNKTQQEQTAPAEQTVSLTDEAVKETAEQSVRVWPVSGSAQIAYSMDKLVYNATMQDWRTHDGLDISAVLGEPVMAAAAGVVTAVYDDDLLGTTVTVSHDGGYVSRYCNLAPMPTVSVGTRVNAGDVLGAVGETALLEVGQESHLHFAVTCNGASVDPMRFLD